VFINKDSLKVKVGSGNYINLGNYILEAKYGYNKLWAQNSGRNLAGKQSGVLIGIFPKIIVQFRRLSKSELETLAPILDSARQTLQYYDPNKKAITTMATYTGDYEITNKHIVDSVKKNEGFQISFIATERRN
jgi:hypothetical protein